MKKTVGMVVFAAALWGDAKWPNALTVTYKDGTTLEIHTESSSANSPLSTSGSVAVSDRNEVHRTVVDKQGRVLFSYDIEAAPAGAGLFTVRVKPYVTIRPGDQVTAFVTGTSGDHPAMTVRMDGKIFVPSAGDVQAAGLTPDELRVALKERLKAPSLTLTVKSPGRVSDGQTIAAIRTFTGVRLGEAVSIDILSNPSTGERIFDVIQPVESTRPAARRETPRAEDEFSLQEVRILINGKLVEEPERGWLIGGAVMIYLPGHGAVYLTLTPVTRFPFQFVGMVERNKLTFPMGNDFVEITSKSNVLKKAPYRKVWVYHDPEVKGLGTVSIMSADGIELLLPKR